MLVYKNTDSFVKEVESSLHFSLTNSGDVQWRN